jgi:hypothetical protein
MTWFGDLLFLAAIALFSVFMVANRVWAITPGQVLFSATMVSAALYIPIWLLWLDNNLASAPKSEILLQGAYQGSVFLSVVPVVAALAAIPILHEIPGRPAWIGMCTVTVGILLALGIVGANQTTTRPSAVKKACSQVIEAD